MRQRLRNLWLVWVVLCGAGPPADSGGATDPPTVPPIFLKTTEPARFVFLEHAGPYWTIGPLFTTVREAMTAHQQSGSLRVRFSGDPTTTGSEALRSRIGFLAEGDWQPDAPFAVEGLAGDEVASMTVEGPYGTTTRYYPVLRAWIIGQGLEPAGPVIEVYPSAEAQAKVPALRTEIQMPIHRPSRGGAVGSPAIASMPPPPPAAAPPTSRPTAVVEAETPSEPRPPRPIAELLQDKNYTRIAEQLIPNDRTPPASLQVWLGQVVFRIGALAKGLQMFYPQQAGDMTTLADTLVARLRAVSASASREALKQVVVRVDPLADPSAARRTEIMRALDHLMGQVASRSVDPPATTDRIAGILQDVQDLILHSPPQTVTTKLP